MNTSPSLINQEQFNTWMAAATYAGRLHTALVENVTAYLANYPQQSLQSISDRALIHPQRLAILLNSSTAQYTLQELTQVLAAIGAYPTLSTEWVEL